MSKAHNIVPTGETPRVLTARLGSAINVNGVNGTGGGMMPGVDTGKIAKLVGESQYDLAGLGDAIEGRITSIEQATAGGWTVGGVCPLEEMYVTLDGLQATQGTGTCAIGDYVVCSTQEAKLTAMATPYPRVVKATAQIGVTPADLAGAAAQAKLAVYPWRIVSLLTGAGAVGTTAVISRQGS